MYNQKANSLIEEKVREFSNNSSQRNQDTSSEAKDLGIFIVENNNNNPCRSRGNHTDESSRGHRSHELGWETDKYTKDVTVPTTSDARDKQLTIMAAFEDFCRITLLFLVVISASDAFRLRARFPRPQGKDFGLHAKRHLCPFCIYETKTFSQKVKDLQLHNCFTIG